MTKRIFIYGRSWQIETLDVKIPKSAPSSSGLGHEVFSLVTTVRIRVGSQWARSSMVERLPFKEKVGGPIPPGLTLFIAGSSNGRTLPFGGKYLGPNPSPAASSSLKLKCCENKLLVQRKR